MQRAFHTPGDNRTAFVCLRQETNILKRIRDFVDPFKGRIPTDFRIQIPEVAHPTRPRTVWLCTENSRCWQRWARTAKPTSSTRGRGKKWPPFRSVIVPLRSTTAFPSWLSAATTTRQCTISPEVLGGMILSHRFGRNDYTLSTFSARSTFSVSGRAGDPLF